MSMIMSPEFSHAKNSSLAAQACVLLRRRVTDLQAGIDPQFTGFV